MRGGSGASSGGRAPAGDLCGVPVLGGLLALLAIALSSCAAVDEPARRDRVALTLENIHGEYGGAQGVAVSPDGGWLAVPGRAPEGRGIYLVPVRPAEGEVRLWVEGDSPAWSPDATRIAFIRDGDLWLAYRDGREPHRLMRGIEGVRDPAWSPDGGSIAFYATQGGAQDIWLVAAEGGEPRQLTSRAAALDDGRFAPAWSPDGLRIAYVSNAADYWHDDIWVVDVERGAARQLSRTLMAASSPVWSPDGSRIALFGTAKDGYWYQDLASIYVLDPEAGGERVVDMQVYATDRIMRHRPIWSGDGSTIYFPYHERGAFELWAVPAEGGVAARVTNLGGSWTSLDASDDGSLFALVRSGPTEGSEAWVLEATGGPARRVTAWAPAWEGLQEPLEVSYRSFDGLYIQGFLFLPPRVRDALGAGRALGGGDDEFEATLRDGGRDYAGPTCPALVQVHGGGTNSSYQGLSLTEQYLASRGYIVYVINYRGGSGFGRAFQDLNVEDWLNNQARDPGAAADWLRRFPFSNGKVGVYGGSYGGSMSLAAVTRTPDKFDAAVPMRGAYSKQNTLEHTDRLGNIFTITGHGGTPDERPDTYEKSNTVARLDRVRVPLLLMHGELDRRVPIQHFRLAVEELERLGKEFETKTYPTEGHGFRDPANRIDMYSRLEAFFGEHLGACTPLS